MKEQPNFVKALSQSMSGHAEDFLNAPQNHHILTTIIQLYDKFDAGINEKLELNNFNSDAFHRFLRFCHPFFEIHRKLNQEHPKSLFIEEQAVMFLWCEVWRSMDDILDDEGKITTSLKEFTQSYSRAERFMLMMARKGLNPDIPLYSKIFDNIDIEDNPKARTDYNQIYVRAKIFEAFLLTFNFPENTIKLHREYVNITGFIHDYVDFIYDFQEGKATYPQRIWRDLGADLSFSSGKINEFQHICDTFISKKIEEFENHFSKSPKYTIENIRITYAWAFK